MMIGVNTRMKGITVFNNALPTDRLLTIEMPIIIKTTDQLIKIR